jgi:hypothetical protein
MSTHRSSWSFRQSVQTHPQFISIFLLLVSTILGLSLSPIFLFLGESYQNFLLVVLIGIFAATLSSVLHLPAWWIRINALFAFCVYCFWFLDIPVYVYLFALIAFVGMYWNTLISRVPYYPSELAVWQELEKLLPIQEHLRVLEIGSGLGGFTRYLSKKNKHIQCVGLETAPVPWLMSILYAKWQKAPCQFKRLNYKLESFADYDLIFAFLSPAVMSDLYQQAHSQMNNSAKVVSYMFSWPVIANSYVQTIRLPSNEYLYVLQRKSLKESL